MNARREHVLRLVRHADVDFDLAQRPGWFIRPFTPEEIDAHPDRDRIEATVKAAAEELVKRVLAEAFDD